MVVRQRVKKDSCHINVRLLGVPRAVVAGAEARYQNFSRNFDRVVFVTGLEECFLDPVDHLVSDFKIFF